MKRLHRQAFYMRKERKLDICWESFNDWGRRMPLFSSQGLRQEWRTVVELFDVVV